MWQKYAGNDREFEQLAAERFISGYRGIKRLSQSQCCEGIVRSLYGFDQDRDGKKAKMMADRNHDAACVASELYHIAALLYPDDERVIKIMSSFSDMSEKMIETWRFVNEDFFVSVFNLLQEKGLIDSNADVTNLHHFIKPTKYNEDDYRSRFGEDYDFNAAKEFFNDTIDSIKKREEYKQAKAEQKASITNIYNTLHDTIMELCDFALCMAPDNNDIPQQLKEVKKQLQVKIMSYSIKDDVEAYKDLYHKIIYMSGLDGIPELNTEEFLLTITQAKDQLKKVDCTLTDVKQAEKKINYASTSLRGRLHSLQAEQVQYPSVQQPDDNQDMIPTAPPLSLLQEDDNQDMIPTAPPLSLLQEDDNQDVVPTPTAPPLSPLLTNEKAIKTVEKNIRNTLHDICLMLCKLAKPDDTAEQQRLKEVEEQLRNKIISSSIKDDVEAYTALFTKVINMVPDEALDKPNGLLDSMLSFSEVNNTTKLFGFARQVRDVHAELKQVLYSQKTDEEKVIEKMKYEAVSHVARQLCQTVQGLKDVGLKLTFSKEENPLENLDHILQRTDICPEDYGTLVSKLDQNIRLILSNLRKQVVFGKFKDYCIDTDIGEEYSYSTKYEYIEDNYKDCFKILLNTSKNINNACHYARDMRLHAGRILGLWKQHPETRDRKMYNELACCLYDKINQGKLPVKEKYKEDVDKICKDIAKEKQEGTIPPIEESWQRFKKMAGALDINRGSRSLLFDRYDNIYLRLYAEDRENYGYSRDRDKRCRDKRFKELKTAIENITTRVHSPVGNLCHPKFFKRNFPRLCQESFRKGISNALSQRWNQYVHRQDPQNNPSPRNVHTK